MTMQSPPTIETAADGAPAAVPLGIEGPQADPWFRRQEVTVALGRRAIAPPDLSVLLQDAASLAASTLEADRFGVAELCPDGMTLTLRLGATQHVNARSPLEECEIETGNARTVNSFALNAAQPVVVTNLKTDERLDDPWLQQRSVTSALICPLVHVERAFGTLGVYSTQPRDFDKRDVLFMESIAHLITLTLARQCAEQALADQNRYTTSVLETSDGPILMLSREGHILKMNRACREITGFALSEVENRSIFSTFLLPEETPTVQDAFDRLCRGETPVRFESYVLTKHAQRRRIAWSFTVLQQDDGTVESLIGTGIDITRQQEALEELDEIKAEADRTQQLLGTLKEQIENRELVFDNNGRLTAGHPDQVERRQRRRRPYPYRQFIAVTTDGRIPDPGSFFAVRCNDISARGFSFFLQERPDFEQIVVTFGNRDSAIYLMGEIVHVTPTTVEGRDQFIIGCRYTGRAVN